MWADSIVSLSKSLVRQKLWLYFADCMGHRRCAINIATERQKSCATVRHAVIRVARYRTGSSRVPVTVSVIRNGHRALPQPTSFPTSVRQGSPKWWFCNLPKHILNYWAYISAWITLIFILTGTPSGLNALVFCCIFERNQLHLVIDTKHCLICLVSLLNQIKSI